MSVCDREFTNMPIRKRLAMLFPWTLRGSVSALCIMVLLTTSGMILRENGHQRVQTQGSHQARMAAPFTEGDSETNDNPYRPDVGLSHRLQLTGLLKAEIPKNVSFLSSKRDIYLGKQPLGEPVSSRDGDTWILEEPPKVNDQLAFVLLDELPLMTDSSAAQSQCPKTIRSVARNSKWFHSRYEQRIKLFMDYEDVRNYSVYRKLEHYALPFGFRSLRRQQLADILSHSNFTNPPLFPAGERPECLHCAVVGSGGVLNGSRAGKEIDSHDLVFRLNAAISKGRFAQDVGIKTSLYTFFPESMQSYNVIDKNALYAFAMFKKMDLDYAGKMVREESTFTFRVNENKPAKYFSRPRISPGKLKIIHPDFFRYVHSRYLDGKKARPTTGALVVMLAVHICDEVTIYGFGYDPRYSLHYYDAHFQDPDKSSTDCHDVHNERGLWEKLHKEGVIRFFYRDTDP